MTHKLFLLFVLALLSVSCYGQNWSGIIDSGRAIDWSANTALATGVPSASWTQCGSTIAAYNGTAATINNAITACGSNQYVKLGTGTFNLSSGINLKSNVALRGSGADQTFLVFSGVAGCPVNTDICISGSSDNQIYGGGTTVNWTAGYSKGTTQITLSNTSGLTVGNILWLDQTNNAYSERTNGDIFVCDESGTCGSDVPSGGQMSGRSQIQFVRVTNIAGSVVTISPGLYMPNWTSAKSPHAWWPSGVMSNAGVEDLSVDHTGSSQQSGIVLFNARNCWIKGIRSIKADRNHVWLIFALGTTIRDSYFFATKNAASQSYGIEPYLAADTLVENNVFQQIVSPLSFNGGAEGNIIGYNYSINDLFLNNTSYMMGDIWYHAAGAEMNLLEGNIGPGFFSDVRHGSHNLNTAFRNRWIGYDGAGKTQQLNSLIVRPFGRFYNIIGNVLGSSTQTTYQVTSSSTNEPPRPIYELGSHEVGIVDDPFVASTLFRWGNWDYKNNAVKWDNTEVPTGSAHYPNSVPASQTLPASFYLSAQPSWWLSGKAWPPIGPDVTGGNIANVGGHAYTTPAEDCYLNVMGGPADGSGSVLTFNADKCYPASGDPPSPPSGLAALVH